MVLNCGPIILRVAHDLDQGKIPGRKASPTMLRFVEPGRTHSRLMRCAKLGVSERSLLSRNNLVMSPDRLAHSVSVAAGGLVHQIPPVPLKAAERGARRPKSYRTSGTGARFCPITMHQRSRRTDVPSCPQIADRLGSSKHPDANLGMTSSTLWLRTCVARQTS
jgi:hypothetical protein